MKSWLKQAVLYEINTWVWLYELSRKYGKRIHLGNVPAKEWDDIASLKVDGVWLMGVWERSPFAIRIATGNPGPLAEFRQVLPDFKITDVAGSPYAIRRYVVDPHLGGSRGLETARKELARHEIRLVLDFVPNHVAPDHPWVSDHPEYFIQGAQKDLSNAPNSFLQVKRVIFANGRDPNYLPWSDVLQLNVFHPGLRQAAIQTVKGIASQCDGIRCDMAMLLVNDVFKKTWGLRAGPPPKAEYWEEVIPAVRKAYPAFLFMAEVYWGMEQNLQGQGFDLCYDKRPYDPLPFHA